MLTADGNLVISGTVGSKTDQYIELFTTTAAGEARTSLYRFAVVPGSSGAFTASFPAQIVPGQQITATSTRDVSYNYVSPSRNFYDRYLDSTSELSAPIRVEPGLTVSNAQVAEGNSGTGQLLFKVSLGAAAEHPVTVDFATGGGPATWGVDYLLNSGTLTFAPGELSKTVAVEVMGDLDVELNEFFNVTLSNPSGAPIADGTGLGFVMNDDAPTDPAFRISDASVVERDEYPYGNLPFRADLSPAVFTVTLDSPQPFATSVEFRTANGTATGGDPVPGGEALYSGAHPDFWTTSGTVTFLPGETTKTITVQAVGDLNVENDETFSLTLSKASAGAIIARGTGVATIWDDDAVLSVSDGTAQEGSAAIFTLTLAKALDHPVSLKYATADGTATAGADYVAVAGSFTIPAGVTVTTVSVSTLKDGVAESVEDFQLGVSNVVGARFEGWAYAPSTISKTGTVSEWVNVLNITDATVVEGAAGSTNTALFQVTLDEPSAVPVQVSYASTPGSAVGGQDYSPLSGVLTFAPGETEKTISVRILDDAVAEAEETFKIILSNASTGSRIGDGEGLGTIVDDERQTLSLADAVIQEGAAGEPRAITFTASLNAPARSPISVHWATADGSSVGGVDYAVTSGELVFAAGEQTKQFTVEVLGDDAAEGNETFFVRLSSASEATILDGEAIGTILTDELALSIQDVSVREGQTARFAVSLSYAVGFPVSVDFSTVDGTAVAGQDYTSLRRTLMFSPGQTQQFVDVALSDDSAAEGDETFLAMLSDASGAPVGEGQAIATIVNDDSSLLISKDKRSATWRDVDGDLVTLRASRGVLDSGGFVFGNAGPFGVARLEQLLLNAGGRQAPDGTNLTFSVERDPSFPGGDGVIDIDWMNARDTRLGTVTLPGHLGAIWAGDGRGTALSRLSVESLGDIDLTVPEWNAPLDTQIQGRLGTLVVHGNVHNTGINVHGSIGSISIEGSISSGDLAVEQGIFAVMKISRIRVDGSVVGNSEHPVLFSAAGLNSGGAKLQTTVISSIEVSGDVSYGEILGGYLRSSWENEHASIGMVKVDGDWMTSSIVAGATAGTDGRFGTDDDSLLLPSRSSAAKIARIIIAGPVSGTELGSNPLDSFGFVARHIGALTVQGAAIPLAGNRSDSLLLGLTEDVRLQELHAAAGQLPNPSGILRRAGGYTQ